MSAPIRRHAARAPARGARRAPGRRSSLDALAPAFVPSPLEERRSPGCDRPARWPSRRGSSRGSSPARSTPSTRRSAPRRSRARAGGAVEPARGARSSGSPGTTTTSPRPARPRGSRADGAVATASLPPRPPDAPLTPMYRAAARRGRAPGARPARGRTADLRVPRRDAGVAGAALPAGGHSRWRATRGALAELLDPLGIARASTARTRRPSGPRRPIWWRAPAGARARRPTSTAGPRPGADGADLRHDRRRRGGARDGRGVAGPRPAGAGRRRFVTRRSRERFDLAASSALPRASPPGSRPTSCSGRRSRARILPTVAYLGGPGELRYLALTPPVYERLGIPRQLPLPRWSGVIVEPRVDRVLEKFGVAARPSCSRPPGALEARLVRSQLPAEARRRRWTSSGARSKPGLRRARARARPRSTRRSRGPTQAARQQALGRHPGYREEAGAAPQAPAGDRARPARAGRAPRCVPNGKPQERVLTVAPFLARYGPDLLDELTDAFRGMVPRRP